LYQDGATKKPAVERYAFDPDQKRDEQGRWTVSPQTNRQRSRLPQGTRTGGLAEISQLVDRALSSKAAGRDAVYYADVSQIGADKIRVATGVDVEGYSLIIDADDVRHAVNRHSDPAIEASRSQLPISREDFMKIPEIMASPDHVELLRKRDAHGSLQLLFSKRFNGHVVTIQAVRTGRRELALKSLQKKKGSRVDESASADSPHRTPRTARPSSEGTDIDGRHSDGDVNRYSLSYAMRVACERYARQSAKGQGEFRWVTIGGHEEDGKEHAGGTPVLLDGEGRIASHPTVPALHGKKPHEVGKKQPAKDGSGEVSSSDVAAKSSSGRKVSESALSSRARSGGHAVRKATGRDPWTLTSDEYANALDPAGGKFLIGQDDSGHHQEWVQAALIYDPDSIPDEVLREYADAMPNAANELAERNRSSSSAVKLKQNNERQLGEIRGGKGRFAGVTTLDELKTRMKPGEKLSIATYGGGTQAEVRAVLRGKNVLVATADMPNWKPESKQAEPTKEIDPRLVLPTARPETPERATSQPTVPGQQQNLFNPDSQGKLFNVSAPKSSTKSTESAVPKSELEKISDADEERAAANKPLDGQRELVDVGDDRSKEAWESMTAEEADKLHRLDKRRLAYDAAQQAASDWAKADRPRHLQGYLTQERKADLMRQGVTLRDYQVRAVEEQLGQHKNHVEGYLARGIYVPDDVLQEYPDLVARQRELSKAGSRPSDDAYVRARKATKAASKGVDTAQVNVPLSKRGDIDRQIDDLKKSQVEEARQERLESSQIRDEARELFEKHGDALALSTVQKNGRTLKDAKAAMKDIIASNPALAKRMLEEFSQRQQTTSMKADMPLPAAERTDLPPYSIARLAEMHDRLDRGETTANEVRQWHKEMQSPEFQSAVRGELEKMSVADLKKRGARGWVGREKKADLINSLMQNWMSGESLNVTDRGISYQMSGDMKAAKANAIAKRLDELTDDHIQKHAAQRKAVTEERQAKIAEMKAGVENPKTIEDFERAARIKGGEDKLTSEQRATYDDLRATARRESERGKKATVTASTAAVGSVGGFDLTKNFHSKRGHDIFTASPKNRVGTDEYNSMNAAARRLGGWYYKAYGGTPGGFHFPTEDARRQFVSVMEGGSADASDQMAAKAELRAQTASESLREKAASIHEAATAELGRERQTNTSRRADMAASIEGRAHASVAKAKTMQTLADHLERGELQHLAGVRHGTHLDTLDSLLNQAKYATVRHMRKERGDGKDRMTWREEESILDGPAAREHVDHAEFPYPRLHKSDILKYAAELSDVPGLKNIAASLKKKAEEGFERKGNGLAFSGGELITSKKTRLFGVPDGKAVRVHRSSDPKLKGELQQHGLEHAYTADGGKTFAKSPDEAIVAAGSRGHKLDLVDAPTSDSEMVTFSEPDEIARLETVASRLKKSPDRNRQRIADDLNWRLEQVKRLRSMDITNPPELRAALREYQSLKVGKQQTDPIKAAERALAGRKIDGFFPTPKTLANRLVDEADIRPGMKVLEPSAGKGDLLDVLKERHGDAIEPHAIEPHSDLRGVLDAKGHKLVGDDFLKHSEGGYDRIVMNPPFENAQDIEHVKHAFSLLAPGGRVVAIMSAGGGRKREEFDAWLTGQGGVSEDLPEGSFASNEAFRKTGVNTRLVTIEKPSMPDSDVSREPYGMLRRAFDAVHVERYELKPSAPAESHPKAGKTRGGKKRVATSQRARQPGDGTPGWQKVGGSSVFVNGDGKITKGCPGLKGEHVNDLIGEDDLSRDRRAARQAHAEAAGKTGKDMKTADLKKLESPAAQQKHAAARSAARATGVSTRDVLRAMTEEHQRMSQDHLLFEQARAEARKMTGLNSGRQGFIENAYRDHSTVPGFDEGARTFAYAFQHLGFDPDDTENPQKVWDFIREGAKPAVKEWSQEVADSAAERLMRDRKAAKRVQKQPSASADDDFGDSDGFDDFDNFSGDENGFDGPQTWSRESTIDTLAEQLAGVPF
jgi:hypothetical protein